MARLTDWLLFSAIPILVLLHLRCAPYTKVEESFNIQAAHDILTYGVSYWDDVDRLRAQYDHFSFPGAVPRTFVGALVLSGIARPFIWLNAEVDRQLLIRAILGLFNAGALVSYALGLQKAYGRTTAVWYTLFQASQFHVIYYASRTLPNMFAFGISTLALQCSLPSTPEPQRYRKRLRLAMYLLTIAGIVFRSELALFLACFTAYHFLHGQISIRKEIIPAAVFGLSVGLAITVTVDSFFWQKWPLWPELAAFTYNVVSNQASNWGTEPWPFYFTNALPRLLLNPMTYLVGIPFAGLHPSTRRAVFPLVVPSVAYVTLYSFVPHKEWRFVLYTIPAFTGAAAIGASYIWMHRSKSAIYRLLSLGFILSTLVSFLLSTVFMLPTSVANYPGAHAVHAVHEIAHDTQRVVRVHLGNLVCQTGMTRFLEMPAPESPLIALPGSPDGSRPPLKSGSSQWVYDKTEDELVKSEMAFWNRFDYALVEDETAILRAQGDGEGKWVAVDVVDGFSGFRVVRPGEGARGKVERALVEKVLGSKGPGMWDVLVDTARKLVTRGWWVEVKMEPKIKIVRRVR